jgi:hypothetical protein
MSTRTDIAFLANRSPRHQQKIVSELSGYINITEVLGDAGLEAVQMPPEDRWSFVASHEPTHVTKLSGISWLFVVKSGIEQMPEKARSNLKTILNLPLDLLTAFAEVMGSISLVVHPNHDWHLLRSNVISIGDSNLLAKGFADYARNRHLSSEAGSIMMGLVGGAVSCLPEKIRALSESKFLSFDDFKLLVDHVTMIESHFDAVCDLAAGRVLHDAEKLVLHFRGNGPIADAELCLSFRAPDGLLSFFPDPTGCSLPVKAIKSVRHFVKSYRGQMIAGEISPHRNAKRLCAMCGLDVSNGHGFLRSQKRSNFAPKGFQKAAEL